MDRLRASLPCFLLVYLLAATVLADGVVRDGLGAISGGRGGTNLGHFDNGAILLDNPAGMVNMRGRYLTEFSIDTMMADLNYTDPENPGGVAAEQKPYALPHLAYIRKSECECWAFGLGVFAPAGFGAEYNLTNLATNPAGTSYRYKSFGALGKILPGVSWQVTDRLSVGGTLGLAISHAELEAPLALQTGPFAGTPTQIDLQATGAAVTWSLGFQFELTEQTMLGVTYSSETRFQLDGNASVNVAGLGRSRYDLEMDLVWPRSLGIGVRHELGPCQTLSADVIWFDWSHAFDRLDLHMREPDNPLFAALLGPQVDDQLSLLWRDSVSVRVGYEHTLADLHVLRTGYVYHRNPVPDSTLTPLIPGILEHAVSVGYGHPGDAGRFDIAYQYSFGPDIDVATSSIVGGDYDNSRMHAAAHWLFLTFSQQY